MKHQDRQNNRRERAIARTEINLKNYQTELHTAKKQNNDEHIKFWEKKIERAKETIKNTKANLVA